MRSSTVHALLAATLLAATLLAATPVAAQLLSIPFGGPKKEKPSPNRDLPGSPAAIAAAVAERGRPAAMTGRDAARHPAEVLQNLGLPLGARVLDIEADPGYYAEIVAAAVGPGGKVTLLVPPAAMSDAGQRRALIEMVGRVPNVALLAATPGTATFAAGTFGFVLLHRFDRDPGSLAAFARKLYPAVRPGGIVGIVGEPRAKDDVAAFVAAGFVVDATSRIVQPPADPDDAETTTGAPDGIVVRLVRPE